jgi:putative PIN family toxin of toxin-antitoxin system
VRIVLDTNVLLSAFGTRGLCEALLAACLEGHEIVASSHVLTELRRHLRDKFRMPAGAADEIVRFVREHATIVVPAYVPGGACADPDDLPVLVTAVAGAADMLVTGDGELLALGRYQGIPIVTPRQCYERLR